MKRRPIGTLPNFNEIYSTEREPMDYDGGITTLPNLNEIYSTEREPMDYDGNGLEVAVNRYEGDDFVRDDGNGLEVAVNRYEGDDFVRDDGNGLEVAVNRYEGDDFEFIQNGWRDWSDPMNKDVDDEVQVNTDNQDQYDTNPKQKKNKIFALLAGVAAAYFLLK